MSNILGIEPGKPQPLGATPDRRGVNFSVFSQNAVSIELLLFKNSKSKEPFQTIKLDPQIHRTYHFWHVFVKGLKPGVLYAYRVDGPNDPYQGQIFNPKKLLVDPYSKGIDYTNWDRQTSLDSEDNLKTSLRSVVIDAQKYDWRGDKPINRSLENTIIYELHVGNFTRSKTAKTKNSGTFRGVIDKIPYLKSLGITAVELLPIFDFDSGDPKNDWGYGSLGFFAPESSYCTEPDKASHLKDVRDMVRALHKAKIEVILDVAFGFTNERGKDGPILSFKGFDNTVYYLLDPNDKSIYQDFSGCKNTLNTNHPIVSKFVLDCLEYWVEKMHVDGFRFDEAALLSRDENGKIVDFPHIIANIEVSDKLANTKIFAEPWDAAGGYLVGKFPGYRFVEWNGRFRDDMRRFIRGENGMISTIASRVTGSDDLYQNSGRKAINTLNFITCHDGFTLNDLVSYDYKHNEANGENNLDGLDENFSCNYGTEGETDSAEINDFRKQQMRNFLTILLLSRGVPMISMGDEVARSQKGNNNAYCQNNDISWFNWQLVDKNTKQLEFTKSLIHFRKQYDLFSKNFTPSDIVFHGCQLYAPGWDDPNSRVISYTYKNKVHVIINMDDQDLSFDLPQLATRKWHLAFNTGDKKNPNYTPGEYPVINMPVFVVPKKSIVVMVAR